jgi:hypothetical protein
MCVQTAVLTEMRHLDMHGLRNVTDEALAGNLRGMNKLQSLCVAGTKYGAAFLRLLPELSSQLTSLHLTQNDIAKEVRSKCGDGGSRT